ncbi:uncharacterized protein [Haliotis cracherodii]|uniref:uncharacterized protein n=1 Tax=Haliotis cracherodii TaxID=6455 RepID=UPI0039ED59A6
MMLSNSWFVIPGPSHVLVKMSKLLKQIAKEKENDFTLATNDFFRPDLKHIGNSIFEIRRHFIFEDDRTVTPRNLDNSLAKVKDCLLRLAQNHAFVLGLDTGTDKEVDNKNHQKTEPCFMFLSETLSVALDFNTSPRPNIAVCDVFIVFPSKPTVVLSLVDGDEESREALAYNTSVARGVRHKLIRFMDEDVNSIHGVINTSTLKDSVAFKTRLKVLADDSSHFVPMPSLLMNPRRYDRVLTAFWAGVAETKSVLRENGEGDDCIRFLTKEQCIILVENINSKDVQVRFVPGSGATTLMLEVARRLSRLGGTLLVCRSREERDRLRSAYASVVSVDDLSKLDLSSYVNIVDETNSVTPETRRHHWQFAISFVQEAELIAWQERVEQEKNVFPLLRSVMVKDRTNLVYQGVKMTYLKKDPEKIPETRAENKTGTSITEKLNDTHSEDRPELQHTDVGEADSRMQEIESLNEELGSLKSNRDHTTRQLNKLQTDWWKDDLISYRAPPYNCNIATNNILQTNQPTNLINYPEVLSQTKVELPRQDNVCIPHRKDQDESNLQRRMTHRQNTDFTKDSKQKFSGATSKLVVVEREAGYTAKDWCHSPYMSTGLIHLLRRYQQGSLKERDLTTLTFEVMAEDEQRLADLTAKNASLEKDFGSTVHIVGAECRPAAISCPKLHLDAARANTDYCHVTTDGELVNSWPDTRGEGQNRLQKYMGTCSSSIPLLPPPSTLTPLPTTPTYWETRTRVRVVKWGAWYVLEMGLCEAGQVDSGLWVYLQRRSWGVRVGRCDRHEGSLCTAVCREGERGECLQNTMSPTRGTQATFHHGVVLDVGRGRVAFIDLDRGIVLVKYDVVFREPLVPVFSVGLSSSVCTMSMSLISGEDVDMTDTKRALVYQALR